MNKILRNSVAVSGQITAIGLVSITCTLWSLFPKEYTESPFLSPNMPPLLSFRERQGQMMQFSVFCYTSWASNILSPTSTYSNYFCLLQDQSPLGLDLVTVCESEYWHTGCDNSLAVLLCSWFGGLQAHRCWTRIQYIKYRHSVWHGQIKLLKQDIKAWSSALKSDECHITPTKSQPRFKTKVFKNARYVGLSQKGKMKKRLSSQKY